MKNLQRYGLADHITSDILKAFFQNFTGSILEYLDPCDVFCFIFVHDYSYFVKRLHTALKTDKRVNIMNEIISSMQVTKMYAWEDSFSALINRARK